MRTEIDKPRLSAKCGTWITASLLLGTGAVVIFHYNHAMAANANDLESSQTIAARQTIADYLNAEQGKFTELQGTLRTTDKLMQQCLADPSPAQVPLAKLRNNPFRADNFTIERIDQGVVVVRNGGYRFELKIAG